MTTSFGHKGRLEDERMLKGAGRYVSDWTFPGQAYGYFVRSDRPHADLVSMDASAALATKGVIAVLTGDDVAAAGQKPMPAAAPMKGRGGSDQIVPPRYSLTRGRVRYVGEPIALVIAESAPLAQDAAEQILIEYNELPPVISAEQSLAPGAPQLHESVPGNLVLDFVGGDEAATNAAFARAAKVVRLSSYHTRVVGNPMEPRAATGIYEPASDAYFLYATTQGAGPMRLQVGAMLGVAPEKIRVVAEEVGGGFGVRFNAYPEYGALLLAAKKLGRPVKWVSTRSEVFVADEQARDIVHTGELALDASGRILGMRFDYLSNVGAYLAFTGSFINTVNLVAVASGVYDVQAVHVQAKLVLTNTVPTAAYRGAGRPVASYAMERLIDEGAQAIGMDPAEFRRRNLVPKSKFPYKIVTGFEYDCGDFEGVLEKALRESDWQGFSARRAESTKRGRLRGRGIATYIEASAAGGFAPFDQAHITWEPDGTLTLRTASHSHGQGHETTLAQIVSGILGIPMEKIRLRTSEPDFFMVANPTGGSRTLLGIGSAMYGAAHEIVKNGYALAGEFLESAAADLEFGSGEYRIKGTDRAVSISALALKNPGKLDLDYRDRPKVPSTYPNGCHVAEIEIEPETGEIDIVAYVAVDDAGTIINHQIVEGQMQGGITQGAGHILGEQAIYDRDTGQLLSGSFMDYPMPRAVLVDNLRVLEHPVPTATNPLGAKGVGEAGVTHFDMPATPQRLWAAIRAAKDGKPRAFSIEEQPLS